MRYALLQGETEEECEETRRGWLAQFPPSDYRESRLVEQLILNDRFLQRANGWYMETPGPEGPDWTSEQQRRLDSMQRHRAEHERAFHRSLNALQTLWKDKRPREEKMSKPETFSEPKAVKKPGEKLVFLDQWADVSVEEGVTRTKVYPPNEMLLELAAKMKSPPDFVYRHMHFLGGVPAEYAWTTDDAMIRQIGGVGNQRMTYMRWTAQIERETGGHLMPCGGNLPRHEVHGPCDCEVCTGNAWMREG